VPYNKKYQDIIYVGSLFKAFLRERRVILMLEQVRTLEIISQTLNVAAAFIFFLMLKRLVWDD